MVAQPAGVIPPFPIDMPGMVEQDEGFIPVSIDGEERHGALSAQRPLSRHPDRQSMEIPCLTGYGISLHHPWS